MCNVQGGRNYYDGDLFELMIPLLMIGIQVGEMSKLVWLIGLIKHAI
jgi:hypothetical protein